MKDKLKLRADLKKNLFYKLLAPANPKSRTAFFGLPYSIWFFNSKKMVPPIKICRIKLIQF